MPEFRTVAKAGAVPDGEGRAFTIDGRIVGVFLIDGEYFAINDLCPHMGASLASGSLEGHTVTCPWHAWRFSVKDGTWLDNPKVRTDSWPVRIEGDSIQVAVPAGDSSPQDSPPQASPAAGSLSCSDPDASNRSDADEGCESGCGAT